MAPIRVARSVVIHHSIADRFAVAFRDQVERNGTYTQPPGSPVSHVTNCNMIGRLRIGVRILCSKIRELCYALMLTLFPIMLHKTDHYAP